MQEEVENRTVTLTISGAKLTGRTLKWAIRQFLNHHSKSQAKKAQAAAITPRGKQSVAELVGQNQGVQNIEISDKNIKDFDRVARKYGIDYAVKKDTTEEIPKYLVFFKARDGDALNAAFREYSAVVAKKNLDEQSKQREKERKARRRAELIEQAEHDPEIAAKLEAEKEKRRAYNRAYQQKRQEEKKQEAIANGTYVPPNPFLSMSQKELAQIADSDPAAAAELEKRRAYGRAKQAQYRTKTKEKAASDPAFAEALKAKNAAANARAKAKMDDLTERAKTDPEAARDLEEKIERRRSYGRAFAERQKQRAANDPEFAAEYETKQREKQRKNNERQKRLRAELRAQAETDPVAAERLTAERAKQVEATTRSRRKLNQAALTDPIAAAKREKHLAHRRDYYAAHKPSAQQAV